MIEANFQAFRKIADSRGNAEIFMDPNSEQLRFGVRRGFVERTVIWVASKLGHKGAIQRRGEAREAYRGFISAIGNSERYMDQAGWAKSQLSSDLAQGKPLTARKVRQVMTALAAKRTENVQQNRLMADHYAEPGNLDAAIGRCAAARPRFSAIKEPEGMLTERDKTALSDRIHARLMAQSEQPGVLTAESADQVVQQEINQALDIYEQDMPDKPVRTVASKGYSGNPDAQMRSVKTDSGWTAGREEVKAAFGAVGEAVPESFERALGDYESLLSETTTPETGGPLAALNIPPARISEAQAKLTSLSTIIDNAIDDYEAFNNDDELLSVLNQKLQGLRTLQQALTAEKHILDSVSRASSESPPSALRNLSTGSAGSAQEAAADAVSLNDLMGSRRFSAETLALQEKVSDYTRILRDAPLVEDGHLSYDSAVSLNSALDEMEMAAVRLQERMAAAGQEQTSGHLTSFIESVDQERGLVCSLLQNPYIVDREGNDKPIADVLAHSSWQDVLNVRRFGIEYGVNVNPDRSDLAPEMRFVPLDSGSLNQVSLVEFAGGESGVFKPEAFAIQTEQSSVLSAHLADYGLPLNQPRAVTKNIGTSNIAQALGAKSVIPDSRIYQHEGTVGLLQEKAQGRALSKIVNSRSRFSGSPLARNPEFLRDLNKLQWIDALTLQADRHNSNIIVDYRNGKYDGLKGIDNDFSFGSKEVALADISARADGNVIGDDTTYGYNAGLPPLIDAETYQALTAEGAATRLMEAVDGLLSSDELAAYRKRVDEVIDHARTLGGSGRVVGSTLLEDIAGSNPGFGLAQGHPWAGFRSADGKSAFELSSSVSNSYYGRLVSA